MAVKKSVLLFQVVTPCELVGKYQHSKESTASNFTLKIQITFDLSPSYIALSLCCTYYENDFTVKQ
jgi:hypothetical protein